MGDFPARFHQTNAKGMTGGGPRAAALRKKGTPLPWPLQNATPARSENRSHEMGINTESDAATDLQIGPTTLGMVRLYILGNGVDLPLDFAPEEAEEIAEEIRAAAAQARRLGPKAPKRG